MNNYFIIPGLGNSGETHWQTWFEQNLPACQRINQKEWDAPACMDWVNTLESAISGYDPATVVLIAHSLGCATIAHWARLFPKKIKGAMLVAPSDLEAPAYDFPAIGFAPIPLQRLPFRTIVVASDDDPWVSPERAKFFTSHWGGELIDIGAAGHINAASGYGPWPGGMEILAKLG